MTATTDQHSSDESQPDLTESADFHWMREQDKKWSGPKLTVILVVTLSLAMAFLYTIAGLGPS